MVRLQDLFDSFLAHLGIDMTEVLISKLLSLRPIQLLHKLIHFPHSLLLLNLSLLLQFNHLSTLRYVPRMINSFLNRIGFLHFLFLMVQL